MAAPAPTALVLRALGLGDLITALPALRMLRAALPEHRIVLATPRRWSPITDRAGCVDALLAAYDLEPLSGAPIAADLAIDLHGNGPASRELLEVLAPQRLLAFAGGPVRWVREEHEVARWCRLLREGLPAIGQPGLHDAALDLPYPPITGSLGAPPAAVDGPGPLIGHGGLTVVHAGAAAPSRRWPPDRLAAVARLLAAEDHDVVVTGGPGEEELANAIAADAGVRAETALSVPQLLGLVGHARVVVSGDTGVAHIASVYGVPSVTLFGPVSPLRWGPPRHPRHQVLWYGDDTGDPHAGTPDPALLRITVAEVVVAARRAQASMSSAPASTWANGPDASGAAPAGVPSRVAAANRAARPSKVS